MVLMIFCFRGTAYAQAPSQEVLVDMETGLTWQKGKARTMTWQQAVDYCENLVLGGYSD
jgi:hypothetical protein